MFRSKSEVDKHVSGLLYKVKNEHERNLRCFHIAQLYYKSQDYESAQRYVTMYLTVKDDSAAAHKLLGQALEGLGQKNKAIEAYTKSLKLESEQSDLVLKVCELLCDKDVEFDPALARYWSERASVLFPHALPVFMLKEKLLTSDSTVTSKDLEEFLHAELKAKPTDINVRIKILKLYAESGRTEMALNNAFEVECRQPHMNYSWYQCINNICKAHNRDNYAKCGWEFYIQWISALDRMCSLSMTETTSSSSDVSETTDCVYNMDQALYHASQCPKKPEILREFIRHASAQLAYHISVLLMKRAKKDSMLWKETKRLVSPLLLLAANLSPQADQSWTISLKESHRKLVQFWVYQAHCRIVQAGHVLLCLVKENHSEKMFFDKVNHFTSTDWKRQIYEKAFSTLAEMASAKSYFMSGTEFSKVMLKLPNSKSLEPSSYVNSFEQAYFGSLHHLVWLGLRALGKTSILEMKLPTFNTCSFKTLRFTLSNLNNISVESINQLDVDSFLYAAVFSTASILEDQKINGFSYEDRPQILPADISSPLCTSEQAKWWSNLCSLLKGGVLSNMSGDESISDLRFSLQRGLEVVRGEGLSPFLIVALARTFAARSNLPSVIEESEGCHARALHLWQLAYPILERLVSNKSFVSAPKTNSLFEYPVKDVNYQEAKALFDEAKFFIGCHYMNTHQYEKAVKELKSIKSPQASFNLAMVYQKWAEEQIDGLKGEEITSEIRCRHVVLATKARDCLLTAKSMIKNDTKSPLYSDLERKIHDIEDLLARIEPENGVSERDANGTTDGSASYESGASPLTEALNIMSNTNQRSTRVHHTSTPHRIIEQKANRFNMSELLDLLSVQQTTSQLKMQQVLEQIKLVLDKLENVASDQRSQRNLVEGLTTRMNNFESEMRNHLSEIKKDMKKPELCSMFDDDDYTDEMMQYQNYSQYYNSTQRVVQNSAAPSSIPYANSQYFSPRIDPLCQGFYNQQGALPFSEGQQLPDFLRQQKVAQPMMHSLQSGIPTQLGGLSTGISAASRLATGPSIATSNVIIPTSEHLAMAPPLQPPLSVNIPSSRTINPPSNAPHNFQIPLPPQPKPVLNIEEREVEEETPPPTYDPLPDYKPIVPLPDEVEVRTGEEEEEILFEKRAKLFRYVEKSWKERGIGNLKILKNKTTGKVRIIMRREKVHKICANHFLTPDMELQAKVDAENAWIWYANDFADEKVTVEKFCVKFKTSEESDEFKTVFYKARDELKAEQDVSTHNTSTDNAKKDVSVLSKLSNSSVSFKLPPPTTVPNPSIFSNVSFTQGPVANKSQFSFTTESKVQEVSKDLSGQTQPSNYGGFTFALAQPKLKIPEAPKSDAAEAIKEPSPFAKFSFGLASTECTGNKEAFSKLFPSNSSPSSTSLFGTTSLFSSSHTSVSNSPIVQTFTPKIDNTPKSPEKEEEPDNFVPTDNFTPVIPLPELVDVVTGEENEEVIFEDHAQLLRFCKETKQWKERGVGQMKILKLKENGSYRMVMRRDKVLKVCCNLRINSDLILKPASSSDRAFTLGGLDHSEGTPTKEIFTLKFKTSEQANKFNEAVCQVQEKLKAAPEKPADIKKDVKPPLSAVIKKPIGSWECKLCYVQNTADSKCCASCSTPREKQIIPSQSIKPEVTITKTTVPSKGSQPSQDKVDSSKLTLAEILKPKPGSWECKDCYTRNNADVEQCAACSKAKPGSTIKPSADTSALSKFTFGIPQSSESSIQAKPSFGITSTEPSFTSSSQTFTFGNPVQTPLSSNLFKTGADSSSAGFSFGSQGIKPPTFGALTPAPAKTTFVFESPKSLLGENTEPAFGSEKFHFKMPQPQMSATSPSGDKSFNDESGYDPEEEEDHIQFPPVGPLPDKIEVVTGEENENILYSHRAKLWRFDSSTKEWKERGVGDVKILQHSETGKIRFLMRREPILKVCLNHLITKDIELRPKDEKSWIWYAVDYSDGTETNEKFAIRFATKEIAEEFKQELDKAKEKLSESAVSSTTAEKHGKNDKEKVQASKSGSDDDVELVFEQKASPELVEKALSLKLPANYYCYLDKPPCPGCCGCESDEKDDTVEENKSKKDTKESIPFAVPSAPLSSDKENKEGLFKNAFNTKTEPTPNIFGGSTSGVLKSAGFSFAQAFSAPAEDTQKTSGIFGEPQKTTGTGYFNSAGSGSGFMFSDRKTFSSSSPQTNNIFTSGISSLSQNTSTPLFAQTTDAPTFGSLAESQNTTQGFAGFGSAPQTKFNFGGGNFSWEGAGTQVFGSSTTKLAATSSPQVTSTNKNDESGDEENDEENTSKEEHDPHFEPVLASLPPKIEVKSGEEEEDILFCERGVLYRYANETKEWKERGVGEMKVLKHRTRNTLRLVMRREQVHKLVCNHSINKGFELKPMNKSEKAFCWIAMNFIEDEPIAENLSIRFKTPEIASKFRSTVEQSIKTLSEGGSDTTA